MVTLHSMETLVYASFQEGECWDLVKRIRKLRWIGLEEEALRLQSQLESYPARLRPTVLCEPPSTD